MSGGGVEVRIGELVRELEKAKPTKGHGAGVASGGKIKEQAIRTAGLSVRTAARYEELVGPPDARAVKAASDAAESSA